MPPLNLKLAARVADAIVQATNEHGAPNGFSPGWLARHNLRPRVHPAQVGRVALAAVDILTVRGWVVTYTRSPSYCGFHVEQAGAGYDA